MIKQQYLRKCPPLAPDHPLLQAPTITPCAACGQHFAAGDVTTLIELGPGDNREDRKLARAGRSYIAAAVPVHWACATGEEEAHANPS